VFATILAMLGAGVALESLSSPRSLAAGSAAQPVDIVLPASASATVAVAPPAPAIARP
jgi:hypothetical protein